MSVVLFADDIEFLQRSLCSAGCYATPFTKEFDAATGVGEQKFFTLSDQIASETGQFDPRSERCIRTLHPKAQKMARQFLTTVRAAGIDVRIISGTRTYGEQNLLFRKGRFGSPPPRVTNAKGGESNHNFAIAWDIGVFANGTYLPESPLYDRVAEVGLVDGLEWGGNWKTFKDRPHYQLATGLTTAQVREKFELGQVFA